MILILRSILMMTVVFMLAACVGISKEQPLYDALGQQAGIAKITHQMILNFAQDERVKHRFKGVNMQKFKTGFTHYICAAVQGPCEYQGDSMKTIHAGYNYTNTEFNAIVDDLILAMEQCEVPVATQNRLLAILAPTYKDIVYH
jgi:hemoglobin